MNTGWYKQCFDEQKSAEEQQKRAAFWEVTDLVAVGGRGRALCERNGR